MRCDINGERGALIIPQVKLHTVASKMIFALDLIDALHGTPEDLGATVDGFGLDGHKHLYLRVIHNHAIRLADIAAFGDQCLALASVAMVLAPAFRVTCISVADYEVIDLHHSSTPPGERRICGAMVDAGVTSKLTTDFSVLSALIGQELAVATHRFKETAASPSR